MTPGARMAAAIEVLDQIALGTPAEKALTSWARARRFAGSKDRAAIRDHVFDVLRARRSLGDGDGRSLLLRLAKRDGLDIDALFSGEGHAPPPLSKAERAALAAPLPQSADTACDIPAWLWPLWVDSLGDQAEVAAKALQRRADVYLRVNRRRMDSAAAVATLATDQIIAVPHETVPGCLRVTENARRVSQSAAFVDGLVELQDAASQIAVQNVPVPAKGRVLDYCAGGGGKALAFADLHDATVTAHDAAPERMADLPTRAARAGVEITLARSDDSIRGSDFDVVFCDAPCSGSGTWRRTPDAKWRLTQDRLLALTDVQDAVLQAGSRYVANNGILAYATCSVLNVENEARVAAFLARDGSWAKIATRTLLPNHLHDGFFLTLLRRK
ncbi:MAG: RsmB/NOP family class I SAM-dependent RNA methyltransferase [Pseudomonadota bacterium]